MVWLYEDAQCFDLASLGTLGFEPVSSELCGGDEVTLWEMVREPSKT